MTTGIAGDSTSSGSSSSPTLSTVPVGQNPALVPTSSDALLNPGNGLLDLAKDDGAGRVLDANTDLILLIVQELKVQNALLAEGLNVLSDVDQLRLDVSVDVSTFN